MKKLLSLLLAVTAAIGCLLVFSACGSDTELQMNTRYIHEAHTRDSLEQQRYLLFTSDGVGIYHYYDESTYSGITDYTVTFKYSFADSDKSAVICFFDSVKFGEKHTGSKDFSTDWNWLLTVSGNVLASAGSYGYTFYISENYLPQIPNYGK